MPKSFTFLFAIFLIFLIAASLPVAAQEALPGDSCASFPSGTQRISSGPEIPGGHILVCEGGVWVSVLTYADSGRSLMQVDYDSGACTAVKEGRLRFSSTGSPPWEYCNGSAWSPFKEPRCQNDGAGGCYLSLARFENDPDFVPENIASGINVLGVTGTFVDGMVTAGLAVGTSSVCAFDSAGAERCWGWNTYGQLGDGTTTTTANPVAVNVAAVTGTAWAQIAAGYTNSCGIRDDGTAWCWGYGAYGTNGNTSNASQNTPVQVTTAGVTGTNWIAIDVGGYHACGLRDDGTGWCWGYDGTGALGNGAVTGNKNVPQALTLTGVSGLSWTSITAGFQNSCGIRDDGTAWCWGRGTEGQLGNALSTTQTAPVIVSVTGVSGSNWTRISASLGYHTCGLRDNGTFWCWGYGEDGQLGHGLNPSAQNTAVQVGTTGVSGTAWTGIATAQWSSCGIRDNNTAWCWGYNAYGQLGNGNILSQNAAVTVSDTYTTGTGWAYLEGGGNFVCGLRDDNTGWCWGDPNYGAVPSVDFGSLKPVAD